MSSQKIGYRIMNEPEILEYLYYAENDVYIMLLCVIIKKLQVDDQIVYR